MKNIIASRLLLRAKIASGEVDQELQDLVKQVDNNTCLVVRNNGCYPMILSGASLSKLAVYFENMKAYHETHKNKPRFYAGGSKYEEWTSRGSKWIEAINSASGKKYFVITNTRVVPSPGKYYSSDSEEEVIKWCLNNGMNPYNLAACSFEQMAPLIIVPNPTSPKDYERWMAIKSDFQSQSA